MCSIYTCLLRRYKQIKRKIIHCTVCERIEFRNNYPSARTRFNLNKLRSKSLCENI